jgi:ABC-type proline/glycine betaine transport system permease subunit
MIGDSIILAWWSANASKGLASQVLLLAHSLAASVLLWSVICRLKHTSSTTTRAPIRRAFGVLATVAVLALFSPVFGFEPSPVSLLLLLGMNAAQITTAYYWRDGVPAQFQTPAAQAGLRRRKNDLNLVEFEQV